MSFFFIKKINKRITQIRSVPPPRPDGAKAYGLSVSEPDGSLVLVPLRRVTAVYRKAREGAQCFCLGTLEDRR